MELFGIIILVIVIIFLCYTFINKNTNDNYDSTNETISSLDEFYLPNITNKYRDIRNLPTEYGKEEASLDNCFIVGTNIYNRYIYSQFMSDYGQWKFAFIRAVEITEESNVTIYDVLYNNDLNKIFLVIDKTRDNSIPENDRTISLKEFAQTGEYEHNGILYWVAFNEYVNEDNFNSGNTFIISEI